MLAATLVAAKMGVDAKGEEGLAEAPARPTRVNRVNIRDMSRATVTNIARMPPAHRQGINPACHVKNNSAKTHAARALTWAISATISTNASRPAMCQRAFLHRASHHAVVVVVVEAAAEAVTEWRRRWWRPRRQSRR